MAWTPEFNEGEIAHREIIDVIRQEKCINYGLSNPFYHVSEL